jgi:REP element-mobilizing transposase RayT
MATARRTFARGTYHHIYLRGNHKDIIFRDASDRRHFLSKLDEFCIRDRISVIVYCLMDNHLHLVLRQDGAWPIAGMMRKLLSGYSRMYNAKYGTQGALFQGRFGSRQLNGPGDLAYVSRYIHLNPDPFLNYKTYRWSSYREYMGEITGICDLGPVLDYFRGSKTSYAIYVEKLATCGETPNIKTRRVAGRRVN